MRVPVYDTPEVAPQQLPGVRQQAPNRLIQNSTIGTQETQRLGQAVEGFGNAELQINTYDQIQQNEAAAKDYDAKHMAAIQGVLEGSDDQPGGYLNTKGQDAISGYQAAADKIKSLPQDLNNTLANPAQQRLVQNLAQMRTNSALAQLKTHQQQQTDVYLTAAGETRIKAATDSAVGSYNPVTDTATNAFNHDNPQANSAYQQSLQTIVSEANDMLDRKGIHDQDVRDQYIKGQVSGVYMGVLGQFIDGKNGSASNMAAARQYFDQVKGQLNTEQRTKVQGLLDAGDQKNQALALSIDLRKKGDIGSQENALDQMFKDGKITADVHQLALSQLRSDNAQRRSEQVESDKALLGQVWDMARNGGSLADLKPSQLAYIKSRGLGASVDSMFKSGTEIRDDSKEYAELSRMADDQPADFAGMNLLTMRGRLTDSHYNRLMERQDSISKNDAKALQIDKVVKQTVGDTMATLRNAGFNFNQSATNDQKADVDKFETSLRDSLEQAQQDWKAKGLSPEAQRTAAGELARGLIKDEVLKGSGIKGYWQTTMPRYKMTQQQRDNQIDMSLTDRQRIAGELAKAGIDRSDANILRYYKKEKGIY
jgi:hypothetical protein